jgi:hypothetical protein
LVIHSSDHKLGAIAILITIVLAQNSFGVFLERGIVFRSSQSLAAHYFDLVHRAMQMEQIIWVCVSKTVVVSCKTSNQWQNRTDLRLITTIRRVK